MDCIYKEKTRTSLDQVGSAPLLSSSVIILTSNDGFKEAKVGPRFFEIQFLISVARHPKQLNGQFGMKPFRGSFPVVTAQTSIPSSLYDWRNLLEKK